MTWPTKNNNKDKYKYKDKKKTKITETWDLVTAFAIF